MAYVGCDCITFSSSTRLNNFSFKIYRLKANTKSIVILNVIQISWVD